ncbi:hypothetical protein [Microbacterium azadirachtae]|uniref:Uncharacterized protein n=1 Tax=Microbacterium azadirachtae TaxID=582680 RepID=A0A0F0LQP5_9MICO|nr:hypothetical protein [Microbacterium azadirachtae]KJL35473.1 hypothetical protein RS86_00469 [Microbacterium azadirachtae]
MTHEDLESRIDALEAESIAASVIPNQIDYAREAIELIHGILGDLVKSRDDAAEFDDDLDRIDALRALML